MASKTGIEWTDATWSPLRAKVKADAGAIAEAKGYTSLVQIATKMQGHVGPHCEHVSHGCDHCYSDSNNGRCLPANGTGLPFDRRSRDLIDPIVDEKALLLPLKWKQPKRIFVANQSDLFGEWYTDEQIDRVFAVMALCPQHTFQVLTKRPERMREYLRPPRSIDGMPDCVEFSGAHASTHTAMVEMFHLVSATALNRASKLADKHFPGGGGFIRAWPLPNVWLGVSVEDQATADARIPLLLQTPAAKRFVSYEPALGPVNFSPWLAEVGAPGVCRDIDGGYWHAPGDCSACHPGLDWIIVGGESGHGARPFDIGWARNTIAQCKAAGVACFVKQLGAVPIDTDYRHWGHRMRIGDGNAEYNKYIRVTLKNKKGGDMSEWPADLRVREFPAA